MSSVVIAASDGESGSGSVLIENKKTNVTITQHDIQSELRTLPPEQRTRTMTDPARLTGLLNDLYRRKVLAHLAKQEGLDQTETVRLKLERARESTLADAARDAHRQALIAEMPDFTKQAQERYQADPEQFGKPAKVQVRHILLQAQTPEAVEEALEQATNLRDELAAGTDFAELAEQHSDDPGTARNGGLLEPFAKGRMVPTFEQAAFALETPGQISEPVVSEYGVHLLQLVEQIPAEPKAFADVEPMLISSLRQQWLKQSMQLWLKEVSGPDSAQIDHEALESTLEDITGEAIPSAPE